MKPLEAPLPGLLDDPLTQIQDLPRRPSVRIAPLRDPRPSHLSSVPSPLEPNAAGDREEHASKAKLSSRKATPKPPPPSHASGSRSPKSVIGVPRAPQTSDSQLPKTKLPSFINLAAVEKSPQPVYAEIGPTKRLRLDSGEKFGEYVQLPDPQTQKKAKKNLPSFGLLAIVNGSLPDPTSKASPLPPIEVSTSNLSLNSKPTEERTSLTERIPEPADDVPWEDIVDDDDELSITEQTVTKKRKPPQKWTEQETTDLLKGVAKFGIGKWKRILSHPAYNLKGRSAVDLKDRFRVCCPDAYKERVKQAPKTSQRERLRSSSPNTINKSPPHSETSKASGTHLEKILDVTPSTKPKIKPPGVRHEKIDGEELARLGISDTFKKPQRRARRPWREEEDANLIKGISKYGLQWTMIQQDPDLDLSHRKPPDLRDRIRNRFPEGYRQAAVAPPKSKKSKSSEAVESELETSKAVEEPLKDASEVVDSGPDLGWSNIALPPLNLPVDDWDWSDNTLPPLIPWDEMGISSIVP